MSETKKQVAEHVVGILRGFKWEDRDDDEIEFVPPIARTHKEMHLALWIAISGMSFMLPQLEGETRRIIGAVVDMLEHIRKKGPRP